MRNKEYITRIANQQEMENSIVKGTDIFMEQGTQHSPQGTRNVRHEFNETCHSVTFYFMKKKTPNDAMTPQRQSQFTPKMKANAVPRLLSSLV